MGIFNEKDRRNESKWFFRSSIHPKSDSLLAHPEGGAKQKIGMLRKGAANPAMVIKSQDDHRTVRQADALKGSN
ncbi:MAG: hypothetical protein COB71_05890 [Thiotrichales bacterium]|nr:MAG: hypothetical protein COB71_05890 [Thiotrichales bacterium]